MARVTFRSALLGLAFSLVPAGPSPCADDGPTPLTGVQACGECHPAELRGHLQTAHHLTSSLPGSASILGSFEPEHAVMRTRRPNLRFEMAARNGEYFQTAIVGPGEGIYRRTERIDIVIGSGKIGQTYAFWLDNRLFQLPISYFTQEGRWANSPGYPDGEVNFSRPIIPRCLECHATYFEVRSPPDNAYNRSRFVLGVSCERCHGPGEDHIAHHNRSGPAETDPIVNPAKLERRRQFDICNQCHAGVGTALRPPFSYRPGEPLDEYIRIDWSAVRNAPGVHASGPYARLIKSRCFQKSGEITCSTCHNLHAQERRNLSLFSARCLKCHGPQVCEMAPELGEAIRNNCIDCHMPLARASSIAMDMPGGFRSPFIRDHFIAQYPEATRRFMEQLSEPTPQPPHGRH